MCVVLQDEKSLPPDDFRQVEKTPQLPREQTSQPVSIVNIKLKSRVIAQMVVNSQAVSVPSLNK